MLRFPFHLFVSVQRCAIIFFFILIWLKIVIVFFCWFLCPLCKINFLFQWHVIYGTFRMSIYFACHLLFDCVLKCPTICCCCPKQRSKTKARWITTQLIHFFMMILNRFVSYVLSLLLLLLSSLNVVKNVVIFHFLLFRRRKKKVYEKYIRMIPIYEGLPILI